MRTKLLTLGLATLLVTAAFGASAFTTGQVTRSQQITVADDKNALIGFESGSDLATKSGDTLALNPSFTNANGVNDKGTFRFGHLTESDTSISKSKATFTVVNQDDVAHTYEIEFSQSDSNTAVNVKFLIYYKESSSDVSEKSPTTITDETTSDTVIKNVNSGDLTLQPNEKMYIVVKVLTNKGQYDDGQDITGTLEVTAT